MSQDKCNRCGSENTIHSGWIWRKVMGENRSVRDVRRHQCKDCGKFFGVREVRNIVNNSEVKQDGNAGTG
mgnify:CR=1 FL=1